MSASSASQTPAAPPAAIPVPALERCVLVHPVFSRFGEVSFRAAESDGTPVLIFPMGSTTAAVPLASLQAELGIPSDSPDGQMLALIAQAMAFVSELRPGDPLPVEVLGGQASWSPSATHQRVAAARLRLQLIAEFSGEPGPAFALAEPAAVLAAVAEAGVPQRLERAGAQAAPLLDVPDAAAVTRQLAAAAHELSFVEALRDRLLRRVVGVMARVEALSQSLGQNPGGAELLSRVRRLTGIAIDRIQARFAALEVHTTQVMHLLRNLDRCRDIVRLHRDWLYSSLRAWDAILLAWEAIDADWSTDTWHLLRRTYRFLAPRFMPVQEWKLRTRAYGNEAAPRRPMIW